MIQILKNTKKRKEVNMSDIKDRDFAVHVLKEFNPEIYLIESCISREGYTATSKDFENKIYQEDYTNEMIFRIDELQWKLRGIEEILKEEEYELL